MVVDNTGHPDVRTPAPLILICGITKVMLCLEKKKKTHTQKRALHWSEAGMSVRKGPNELTGAHA